MKLRQLKSEEVSNPDLPTEPTNPTSSPTGSGRSGYTILLSRTSLANSLSPSTQLEELIRPISAQTGVVQVACNNT